ASAGWTAKHVRRSTPARRSSRPTPPSSRREAGAAAAVTALPSVIVDPHFRAMGDIFSAVDLERLHATVDVVWGRDEPMPLDRFRASLPGATAIVSGGWRYG